MNFKKNSKGITLIALVITIIVLLILAAVSLNLVAGGDGILGRATTAVNATKIAAAQEQAELLMTNLKMDYYEAIHANKATEMGAYIESQIGEGKATADYFVTVANGEITVYEGNSAVAKNKITTGTLTLDGKVDWDTENAGGSTPSQPETPEIPEVATKYTVSYDANGGTGSVPASAEYEENATVTVDFTTVPTKEGFKFLGWAEESSATTATYTSAGTFTMGTANVTLYAIWKENAKPLASQITTDNYGDYVNLGTSYVKGNALATGTATEDWRIFHKDENGVYLILADYLPYSYETSAVAGSSTGLGTGLLNYGTDRPYNWNSNTDRKDLIDRLNAKESLFPDGNPWNKLISNTYTAKGITVKGAFDLETWVESWNAKGYTELFIAKKTGMSDSLDGFYVGTAENPTTYYQNISSDSNGYYNTLYLPHQTDVSNNLCYWLASPAANDAYSVMSVGCHADVGNNYYGNNYSGVRPAVFLPSDIQAEKVDGVWQLDI